MKRSNHFAPAIAAAVIIIFLTITHAFAAEPPMADAAAVAQADMAMKQILHSVQLAVERYKVDYGVCPDGIQALADAGYMMELPDNPYAKIWSQAPARCISEELRARPTPGAIVYHPFSMDGDSLTNYFLLAAGTERSETNSLSGHDLFYGEPRWDSLRYFLPDGKGDGQPERYIMCLAVPIIKPEMAVAVTHDAAWLNAQPAYKAKQALHSIQLAAERYSVDNEHGHYPPDIQTLVDQGYIYMPINPYYGIVPGATMRIEVCAPGEFKPGGIYYEPFTIPESLGYREDLVGYQIGIYGDKPDGGIDAGAAIDGKWRFYPFLEEPANPDGTPDGFLIVLGSGPAPGQSHSSPGGT